MGPSSLLCDFASQLPSIIVCASLPHPRAAQCSHKALLHQNCLFYELFLLLFLLFTCYPNCFFCASGRKYCNEALTSSHLSICLFLILNSFPFFFFSFFFLHLANRKEGMEKGPKKRKKKHPPTCFTPFSILPERRKKKQLY
jgi:bacteriorhodopsin